MEWIEDKEMKLQKSIKLKHFVNFVSKTYKTCLN